MALFKNDHHRPDDDDRLDGFIHGTWHGACHHHGDHATVDKSRFTRCSFCLYLVLPWNAYLYAADFLVTTTYSLPDN